MPAQAAALLTRAHNLCAERAPAPVTRTLDVIDAPLYEDTWVTVYGFPCEHSNVVSAVLQEFQACGNLQRWCPGPTSNCNWLHLQFETRHGAQRALHRNGLRLTGALNMLLGVQPPSAQDRRHIAQHADTQWGASAMQPSAVPVRSYVLDSSTKVRRLPHFAAPGRTGCVWVCSTLKPPWDARRIVLYAQSLGAVSPA
jgi:hypothetical protein